MSLHPTPPPTLLQLQGHRLDLLDSEGEQEEEDGGEGPELAGEPEAEDAEFASPSRAGNFLPVNVPSEELLAQLEAEAAAAEEGELPEGYVPRGRCMSPLEKKIRAIQVGWLGGCGGRGC